MSDEERSDEIRQLIDFHDPEKNPDYDPRPHFHCDGCHVDQLRSLLAERDSLRGVVQAARELHINDEGDGIAQPFCVHDGRQWPCPTARALAAAADAPQPEGEVRCWAHEPSESCDDCEDNPVGPQPARCEHKYRGYHEWRDLTGWHDCPGPSPAVLPEKEQQR